MMATSARGVAAFGLHDKGRVREDDQDYLLHWGAADLAAPAKEECLDADPESPRLSPVRFFVVADGMGGLAEGSRAARAACQQAFGSFRSEAVSFNASLEPGLAHLTPSLALAVQRVLVRAVEAANRRVWEQAQGRSGSTLLTAAVCDHQLLMAAAGDCRAYLLRPDGPLELLTADDNLAWEPTASGRMTSREAAEDGLTSRLTRFLGRGPDLDPARYAVALAGGERLLLCTDGLYSSFAEEGRIASLLRGGSPEEAVPRLIKGALERGGHDNITGLVVDIPRGERQRATVLIPATPIVRRQPRLEARLRQWRHRAAAGRWGVKAGLGLVVAGGLATLLLLTASSSPDLPAAGTTSGATVEQTLPTPPPPAAPSQGQIGSTAGGTGSASVCVASGERQICPVLGDTLTDLAARYGIGVDRLAAANPNISREGPVPALVPLLLPEATPVAATPLAATPVAATPVAATPVAATPAAVASLEPGP